MAEIVNMLFHPADIRIKEIADDADIQAPVFCSQGIHLKKLHFPTRIMRRLFHPEKSVLEAIGAQGSSVKSVTIHGFALFTKKAYWVDHGRIQKFVIGKNPTYSISVYSAVVSESNQSSYLAALFNECKQDELVFHEIENGTLLITPSIENYVPVPNDFSDDSFFVYAWSKYRAQINFSQFGLITEPQWVPYCVIERHP